MSCTCQVDRAGGELQRADPATWELCLQDAKRMCREVVAVLKRLKEQRDMSLNEVGVGSRRPWVAACPASAAFSIGAAHAAHRLPSACGSAAVLSPTACADTDRQQKPGANPRLGGCWHRCCVQVRLTVAIEDPRARERRLMGMEVGLACLGCPLRQGLVAAWAGLGWDLLQLLAWCCACPACPPAAHLARPSCRPPPWPVAPLHVHTFSWLGDWMQS